MQYRAGHGGWVFQEGAEKAHCRQLQRVAQAVAVAPLGGDPLTVIIVQVEVACQFVAGERVWIAAVAFPLCGGQEADRHGVKALRRRKWLGFKALIWPTMRPLKPILGGFR